MKHIPLENIKDRIRIGDLMFEISGLKQVHITKEAFTEMCNILRNMQQDILEQAGKIKTKGFDGYVVQPLGDQIYMLIFLEQSKINIVIVDKKKQEVRQTMTLEEYKRLVARLTDLMWKTQNVVMSINTHHRQTQFVDFATMVNEVKESLNTDPARAGPDKDDRKLVYVRKRDVEGLEL